MRYWSRAIVFYPRSPCGERPERCWKLDLFFMFSIHALLAESDRSSVKWQFMRYIFSIHALLAESDLLTPRSTTGQTLIFLSTLSLRRATGWTLNINGPMKFSIHALLAESDIIKISFPFRLIIFLSTLSLRRATLTMFIYCSMIYAFLSTLSLRRATWLLTSISTSKKFFYPRSPCGERRRSEQPR